MAEDDNLGRTSGQGLMRGDENRTRTSRDQRSSINNWTRGSVSEREISSSDSSVTSDESPDFDDLLPPRPPMEGDDNLGVFADPERMDRLFAHMLQLRELRAQNFGNNLPIDLDPDFLDQILQFDALMDPLDDMEDIMLARAQMEAPTYPVGQKTTTECSVCCEVSTLYLRRCCDLPVCEECTTQYFSTQVEQANVKIECMRYECRAYIHRDEILARLPVEVKEKYYKYLVDANKNPHMKTCPRCSHVMTLDVEEVRKFKAMPRGYKVTCTECSLIWCFPCQAPWHEGIKCKEFRKGDKLLRVWAKEQRAGQQNAQKCPSCKVFIQRAAGCDHMICSRCNTNFCYRCGEKFRQIKFIGDHYSRLSVFGCKYRFLPDRPTERKLIRGAILGGKLLAAPVVAGLAVGGAAVLLGVGTIIAPFYGGYKLHKKLQIRKQRRRQRAEMARLQQRPALQLHGVNLGTMFDREDFLRAMMYSERDGILALAAHQNNNEQQVPSISALVSGHDEEGRRAVTTAEIIRGYDSDASSLMSDYWGFDTVNVITRYADKMEGDTNNSSLTPSSADNNSAVKLHVDRQRSTSTGETATVGCQVTVGTHDKQTATEETQCPDMTSIGMETAKSEPGNNPEGCRTKEEITSLRKVNMELSFKGDKNDNSCDLSGDSDHPETVVNSDVDDSNLKSENKSESDGKSNNAYVPWLIVCGKVPREKEEPERKTSLPETGGTVTKKICKGQNSLGRTGHYPHPCDSLPIPGKLEKKQLSGLTVSAPLPIRSSTDSSLELTVENLPPKNLSYHWSTPARKADVGPFGSDDDDDSNDDLSLGSSQDISDDDTALYTADLSSSCGELTPTSHFTPGTDHDFDYIDQVSKVTEVTCL